MLLSLVELIVKMDFKKKTVCLLSLLKPSPPRRYVLCPVPLLKQDLVLIWQERL